MCLGALPALAHQVLQTDKKQGLQIVKTNDESNESSFNKGLMWQKL